MKLTERHLEESAARVFGETASAPRRRQELRDAFSLDLTEASQDGLLVQGIAIHGRRSRNGRVYSDRAMRSIAEQADGMRAFADHPSGNRDAVRPVADLIGRIRRPRVVADRIRADLRVVDAPPWRDLLPALREDDFGVGFSIRATGRVERQEDGPDMVEDVEELKAVELVSKPATLRGLQESLTEARHPIDRSLPISPQEIWEANWKLFS